jgi:hypothetical protein
MISAQLSLFDTASVIQPTYKVGDLVKIRKRPIAASYVKKGDIVTIAALHPIDGSIKFWNKRSERWEFLHPDEIGNIIPCESADSVTSNAEVGVTESIPEPADSVTRNAVSTYRPRGTARGMEEVPLEYFRFSYREGSKVRHIHIKGGNTSSPIAQARVAEVRSQLAAGIPPTEIAKLLLTSRVL